MIVSIRNAQYNIIENVSLGYNQRGSLGARPPPPPFSGRFFFSKKRSGINVCIFMRVGMKS